MNPSENPTTEKLPLEVTVQDVHRMLEDREDFLLVDCREPHEYEFVHLKSATLIPMSQIQGRVEELEPHRDRRIVVHCHHGGRSMQVTQWLRQIGYDKTQNMAGGIHAWSQEIDAGLPTY